MIFQNYRQCLDFLYSRDQFSIKLGLERPAALFGLAKIQCHTRRFIHVAGTNGKGSICRYIAHLLKETGFKQIGLYTSPHLVSFRERITVNNKPIGKTWIVQWMNGVYPDFNPLNPTYFEYVTAMALAYFQEKACEISVIETGLGGRLDATNCITPAVSVITPVSSDHTQILGKTISAIWREKAGIMKSYTPVIINEGRKRYLKLAHKKANEMKCEIWNIKKDFPPQSQLYSTVKNALPNTGGFQGRFGIYKYQMRTPLQTFQKQNLAQAFAAIECLVGKKLPFAEKPITLSGMDARQQVLVSPKRTPIVLDCAHNEKSAKALEKFLRRQFPQRSITIIFSIMSDKEIRKIVSIANSIATQRLFVSLTEYNRSLNFNQFRKKYGKLSLNWKEFHLSSYSLNSILNRHNPETQLIVFFGSFYLVGKAISLLAAEYEDLRHFRQFSGEF